MMAHSSRRVSSSELEVTRLRAFVEEVANTLYDGRECSHDEGCHDHWSCSLCSHEDSGYGRETNRCCPLGSCCDPVDMENDETHGNLVALVEAARTLLVDLDHSTPQPTAH